MLKRPQPPPPGGISVSMTEGEGAERCGGKKSHGHEYSCEFLSMLGVCLHVFCVRFWSNAPANEFLMAAGERVPSDGNFGFVVIIYCLCYRCT